MCLGVIPYIACLSQDQITAMQKEHRGTVDGLREDLCRLETELQTARHHQQQQEQSSASTPVEAVERSKGRHHDEVRLPLHGFREASPSSEPRSAGEVSVSAWGTLGRKYVVQEVNT